VNRALREILESVAGHGGVPQHLRLRAQGVLAREKLARATRLKKSRPRRKQDEVAAAVEAQRHTRLVLQVMDRAGNCCELCGRATLPERLDPHHLEPGPSKARHERLFNVMAAHRSCHDAYHANPRAFVERVKLWCALHGYPLPKRREYR
jgi:hypothetical protein